MKGTVLAENSYFINFHWAVSTPEISTDVSPIDVSLFPSF